ncbi:MULTISPECIES: DUF6314 family protein [unclassified Arthrobacter]|uniref:DUF6314 family protein n=1 Tax=unclassified Arthrobacter TaxID=235627 RepID=UPI001492EB56|nr:MULTISPECIES: DUF6314 family protein [unclassified Arthrobacter]MBE0010769.1 hypothetical protein [Arthrobacter sp. AET 35A]NOJ64549.1 hypothetical protein [Arthrobacter sp. 147(2020)]
MNECEPFRLGAATTLLDHLRGTWSVERTLQDHTSGLTGVFTGIATFADDDDALRHRECGSLAWAGALPTKATRELLWRATRSAAAAEVFFADGRFFHVLDLTDGRDTPAHPCAPDHYLGSFVLLDHDRWRYTWRVSGPAKDLTLDTHLTRVTQPPPAPLVTQDS